MGISLVNLIDFLAVIFDVTLLTIYFNIFCMRKALTKFKLCLFYVVAITVYYLSSIYLFEAYQKTIVYLAVCLFLSFCYQGMIVYKMLLTVLYAGLGVIVETVVAFFLTIIDQNIYRLTDGSLGYVLGVILSNVLVSLIIGTIWFIRKEKFKNNAMQEIVNSYWSSLFLTLTIITIIISCGIDYLTIKQGMENGIIVFLLLECLLVVFDVVIFIIFREMEQLQRKKLEAILLMHQNEVQQAFYKESIEKNRQLKKIIHDEKNFLLGIGGYLKDNKVGDAIAEIEGQVNQLISNIYDYTGNIAIRYSIDCQSKKG